MLHVAADLNANNTSLRDYLPESNEYQFYIIEKRSFANVFEVDFQLVGQYFLYIATIGVVRSGKYVVLVAIAYRGKRRYTRTHIQYMELPGSIKFDIFAHFGTGTHKTHIA